MIKFSSDIPVDIFDAIQEQAQKLPALVRRGLPRVTRPIDRRMLDELSAEPGPPRYPIRWKSERQRTGDRVTEAPRATRTPVDRNWSGAMDSYSEA